MRVNLVMAGALGMLLSATAAGAQEGGVAEWFSANVSVTSDYAFRGISQTLEEPAIQGEEGVWQRVVHRVAIDLTPA